MGQAPNMSAASRHIPYEAFAFLKGFWFLNTQVSMRVEGLPNMRAPSRHIPYEAFELGEENVLSDPKSLRSPDFG